MNINYDREQMASAFRNFYNATGISIQFFDENSRSYVFDVARNRYCNAVHNAAVGKHICRESDKALFDECRRTKKTAIHICHAGLVDIAIPILYDGVILGYLILGRMKRDDDFSVVSDYIASLGLDVDIMKEYYLSLPHYDSDKIQGISSLATMLAKYILLSHMLTPGFNNSMQRVLDFIEENLHTHISVNDIADGAHISKSTLYKNFKDTFGCTVAEYMMKKRIERAEKLLLETDISIEEISAQTGFSSAAYFTANFKRQKGITPLKFRKNNAK